MACDCNSQEMSDSSRLLNGPMVNTAQTVGWMIGDPPLAGAQQDTDFQHIDYVFYRGQLEPIAIYPIRDMGSSDHLPVLALFNFVKVHP